MNKLKEKYSHCNYCKHFMTLPNLRSQNLWGVCDKTRGYLNGGYISVISWRLSCIHIESSIRPVYDFKSPDVIEEYKKNFAFKTSVRSSWIGVKLR